MPRTFCLREQVAEEKTISSADIAKLAERLDRSGMLALVESFPDQGREAWEIAGRFLGQLPRSRVARVVVCGMGGSAIGADLTRELLAEHTPVEVCRDYRVSTPWLEEALLVFSSYSGNTAEVLSAFAQARGEAARIAVTSGGELERLCRSRGVPCCLIPGGLPPRAAIGYSLLPLLRFLAQMGLAPNPSADVEEALALAADLARSCSLGQGGGEAISLAEKLHGRIPVIYSYNGLLAPVAKRWSCQFNENSKTMAHRAHFPELCHNEIVGWEVMPELLGRAEVIVLADAEDHPRALKQMEVTLELISPLAGGVTRVESRGSSRLARMLWTMLLGDFVSVYLAFLNGVDPTPVEKISYLKDKTKGS